MASDPPSSANENFPVPEQHDKRLADEFRDVAKAAGQPVSASATLTDIQREADRLLLDRFVPPSVLINENLDIIEFRGRTAAYLKPPPGDPTTNLLKMAREGLILELRGAIAEVRRSNQPVRRDKVRVCSPDGYHEIGLEVIPVRPPAFNGTCLLIIFIESQGESGAGEEKIERMTAQMAKEPGANKERLYTVIEQQETANQELRSANEVILSSNEVLRSTNEDLEISKQGLQLANDRLTVANEGLQFRNLELIQLNDDLGNLLSSTTIPLVIVGPDLRIRRFTQAARHAMNLVSNDIGLSISDLKARIGIDELEGLVEKMIKQMTPLEHEVCDRAGHWHSLQVLPYRASDQRIEGAVIMLLDIDVMKNAAIALFASEERLRLALEAGAFGTWHIDLNTERLYWDERMHQILGLAPDSPREGERFTDALAAEDRGKLRAAQHRSIESSGPTAEEVRFTRPDGTSGWLSLTSKLFAIAPGAPGRIAGVGLDISAHKLSQIALAQRIEELKETDRQKNEFLALLAHELRNPLASIGNAIEILGAVDSRDARLTDSRDTIAREVQHLSRVLEDLLDLSRLTRDRLVLRRAAVKLADVVRESAVTSKPYVHVNGHRLSVNLPSQDVWLNADPVRLCQVFSNLLINAAKYTRGQGLISLTANIEAGQVSIHVCDNGIGIPKELLGRIFEIFAQGESSNVQGGLGIGLALVKSLVELHNGTVEAKSDGNGKGSEFIVRLPIIAPPAERAAGPVNLLPSHSQSQRILVVDDNTMQAKTLGMLLTSYGHVVRTANDGPAALSELAGFVPDIALIDLGLPAGMTGYELARRMRAEARFAHTLLVAQTGWGRDEDRKRSHAAGFDFHLVKPLDHDRLRRIITHVETKN
jgi:two-component system CheB/CheR fusion protein